jgi:hypothetical protein
MIGVQMSEHQVTDRRGCDPERPQLVKHVSVRLKDIVREAFGNRPLCPQVPEQVVRLIDAGGTCWGGQSFVAHFGLGDATNVDVLRIEWSSGSVQELYNVPAKQYMTVTQPARLSMPSLGELHIQCWKEMAYRVEGSSDLAAWTPLATVTNLTGKLQWTDLDAPGRNARFYRAVKQ